MANQEHLEILKKAVPAWNEWRTRNAGIKPDLSEADLGGAKLSGAKLSGGDLSGANLGKAKLNVANLRGANLGRADLNWADLSGADLADSVMGETSIADVDLIGVKGLETVSHFGPSSIGIDTIYPAGATTLIVSLRIISKPRELAIIEAAVFLLVAQAWLINRLPGCPIPCETLGPSSKQLVEKFGPVRVRA